MAFFSETLFEKPRKYFENCQLTKTHFFGIVTWQFFFSFWSPVLVIRMQRTGRKNAPFTILWLRKNRNPFKENFLNASVTTIPCPTKRYFSSKERIEYWISVGAQPSQTVARLCTKMVFLQRKNLFRHVRKTVKKQK